MVGTCAVIVIMMSEADLVGAEMVTGRNVERGTAEQQCSQVSTCRMRDSWGVFDERRMGRCDVDNGTFV
jgi:hypothetical protein